MNLDPVFSPDSFKEENSIDNIIRDNWIVFGNKSGCAKYSLNFDGSIDVFGDVKFPNHSSYLPELPLKFNNITGNFDCSKLERLTSLKGSPLHVNGKFDCSFTNIVSLQYAPKTADVLIFDNLAKSLWTGTSNNFKQVQIIFRTDDPLKSLPNTIIQHEKYLHTVFKYQDYYEIWSPEGRFNEIEFVQLIADIKDGLE